MTAEIEQILLDNAQLSLENGLCIDCGAKMPPPYAPGDKSWEPHQDWHFFTTFDGEFAGWVCPVCDQAADDETQLRPVRKLADLGGGDARP